MIKNNILIALNTVYHVEVALSLYVSLEKLGFKPTIFVMRPDVVKYNLCLYLFNKKIDFITDYTPGLGKLFNKVLVVSAYPTIERPDSIPLIDHPIFDEFKKENIILIAHRVNMDKNLEHPVICVTPLAKNYGLDYIYLCENPSVGKQVAPTYPLRFLIQGNFYANRRDLHLIDYFLENTKINYEYYKFIFLGDSKERPLIKYSLHGSVFHYKNLNEELFYARVNDCDYILPLISQDTANQTYLKERLSSSLSFSFAFNKPMLIHKDINKIYESPAIEYADNASFLKAMENSIDHFNLTHLLVSKKLKDYKQSLETHNKNTLIKYLN